MLSKLSTSRLLQKIMPDILKMKKVDPYSLLEIKHKFIFIHVPKTAGKAIIKSLFDQKSTGHYKIINYKYFNKELFDSFYKFGIVRNPWDRIVSSYFYLSQGGSNDSDANFAKKYLADYSSFRDFIVALKDKKLRKAVFHQLHFVPQYKYICDNRGNILVDYLGKYELLEDSYEEIRKKLDIEKSLIKHNSSKHKDYKEYYDAETKDIVYELYKEDINIFNYSFE